jgi:hypothetical protein
LFVIWRRARRPTTGRVSLVTDKVALTLVERHGKSAMVCVYGQLKGALSNQQLLRAGISSAECTKSESEATLRADRQF